MKLILVISTLAGIVLLGCGPSAQVIQTSIAQTQAAMPTITEASTPTIISLPTRIPTTIPTPTSVASNCLRWSQITGSMVGEDICVYGIVNKVDHIYYKIRFSADPTAFFLASGTYLYDVNVGDCVFTKGKVLESAEGVPYMNPDQWLYRCESWMK